MPAAPSAPPSFAIASATGTTFSRETPASRPWDTGDHERNWSGYFILGTDVLRNRVGVQTREALLDAENDFAEARLVELRETPALLGIRRYDLAYLQAIHRHLFQDVYEWAGELRTVGIEKGAESFCPPGSIGQPMDHVAAELHRLSQLRSVPERNLAGTVAYLYDYANFAHPFREGNGRATREFFNLLLSERGAGLDWERTTMAELHSACHAARTNYELAGLVSMFQKVIDDDPAYEF